MIGAVDLLRRLCAVIDGHRWDDLPALLHPDFTCRLVHTGEVFDRDGWVRFNADYPGFEGLVADDVVGSGDRAAVRATVTGRAEDGTPLRFAVASFGVARDGLLVELVEVWADVDAAPPPGTRPA